MSEAKYYIFNERGMLRNRVSFKKQAKGQIPIAVSPNGLNFIFRDEKIIEKKNMLTLFIMRITE